MSFFMYSKRKSMKNLAQRTPNIPSFMSYIFTAIKINYLKENFLFFRSSMKNFSFVIKEHSTRLRVNVNNIISFLSCHAFLFISIFNVDVLRLFREGRKFFGIVTLSWIMLYIYWYNGFNYIAFRALNFYIKRICLIFQATWKSRQFLKIKRFIGSMKQFLIPIKLTQKNCLNFFKN